MSVLNLKYNSLYIHVPKTAGSAMESRAFVGGGGHQNIEYFKRMMKLSVINWEKPYEDVFKWGFCRNPYDRFASAVMGHYLSPDEQDFARNPNEKRYPVNKEGFNEFIRDNHLTLRELTKTFPKWVHLIPQHYFLSLGDHCRDLSWKTEGYSELDFLGRFENKLEDWKKVCDRFGFSDELPPIRMDKFTDFDSLWEPETKALIYEVYKKDFEMFGYEK